jgi:hypothetical protein
MSLALEGTSDGTVMGLIAGGRGGGTWIGGRRAAGAFAAAFTHRVRVCLPVSLSIDFDDCAPMRRTFLAVDEGTCRTGSVSVRSSVAVPIVSLVGEPSSVQVTAAVPTATLAEGPSPVAALASIRDSEDTILVLLLREGIPSKPTTASLGPVGKTIGDGVCAPLATIVAGTGAVGTCTKSIEQGTTGYIDCFIEP